MDSSATPRFTKPAPIPALTGLRFIAAFSVMLAHALSWSAFITHNYSFIRLLSSSDTIGIPLFFVLSGFVIHYNYSHSFSKVSLSACIRFLIARFSKLYPLYFLVLMIYLFHKNILPGNASYLWRYLTMTQAWQFLFTGSHWIGHLYLAPAWSVSIEWFLYIFYALVGIYLFRFKTVNRCLIAFVSLSIVYYLAVIFIFPHINALNEWTIAAYAADMRPQSALITWLFNVGPVGCLFEFTLGMLMAQIFLLQQHKIFTPIQRRLMDFIFCAAWLVIIFLFVNPLNNSLMAFGKNIATFMAPFFALILLMSAWNSSWISRCLGSNFMVRMGEASYPMYLLHILILPSISIGILKKPTLYWACIVMMSMLFIMVLSLITYQCYEKPSQRFLKKHSNNLLNEFMSINWQFPQIEKYLLPILMTLIALSFTGSIIFINRPDLSPKIKIVSANYGANCQKTFPKVLAYSNLFYAGNATLAARQLCLHAGKTCTYHVELEHLGGDPVPGCMKDYSIKYQCNNNSGFYFVRLTGEASGKLVKLTCRSPKSPRRSRYLFDLLRLLSQEDKQKHIMNSTLTSV